MGERARFGRWIAALVVLAGFGGCLAANYPGHFAPDAIWQLAQGRAGRFNDWHPPVMAWLMGLSDRLVPGGGLFMALEAALFYGGVLAFAALEPRPRLIGLTILALCMFSPLALVAQGAVLKDTLFADAALAGFAALAWAGRCWTRRSRRWGLLFVAAALFLLATLTRQNGLIAPSVGAVALAALVFRASPPERPWPARLFHSAMAGAVGLALIAMLAGAATMTLRAYGDGRREDAHHLKILQVWDLAGAVRLEPGLELPALHAAQPATERFVRQSAAPVWRSAGADNIVELPGGDVLTNPAGPAAGRDWRRLVTGRPDLYLTLRARVWFDTLMTPNAAQCPMVIVGIDGGAPAQLRQAGLVARDDDRDDWDEGFAALFFGTPVFSHASYGLLILGVLGLHAWRWRRGERDPGLMVGGALGLAGLGFAASFFFVSVDCDYRFLYFLDVAAMALVVNGACARGPHGTR